MVQREGGLDYISDTVTLACWLFYELFRTDSSRHARLAGASLLLLWVCNATYRASQILRPRSCGAKWLAEAAQRAADCGQVYVAFAALAVRASLAEDTFGVHRASKSLMALSVFAGVVPWFWEAVAALALAISDLWFGRCLWHAPWLNDEDEDATQWFQLIGEVSGLFTWISAGVLSTWTFTAMHRTVRQACPSGAVGYVHAEAQWAARVIARIRGATAVACSAVSCVYAVFLAAAVLHIFGFDVAWLRKGGLGVLNPIYSLIELLWVLVLTGFFRPHRPPALQKSEPRAPRVTSFSSVHSSGSQPWAQKVRSMAARSIDVWTLLDFYDKLGPGGEVMWHFDPQRHTTNDVVRCAIVPLSCEGDGSGGFSYAQAYATSSDHPAECMVTHDWRNLFVDLVAGVMADALDLDEYQSIAASLVCEGTAGVRASVLEAGTAARRYWICAFCVNQHASICGGFGPEPPEGTPEHERWDRNRHDSVTGDLHQCCPCREPKVFNDAPDRCELNKFDDMMALLHRAVPGFRQLITVDQHFQLFSRLWCIAELVEAHHSGIPQHVCVPSNDALAHDNEDLSIYVKLANLRVTECSASRPEDKACILAKIPDTDEFDAQLQTLIFGARGIMSQRLVGFDVLLSAARSARRVRAASGELDSDEEARGSSSSASSASPSTAKSRRSFRVPTFGSWRRDRSSSPAARGHIV